MRRIFARDGDGLKPADDIALDAIRKVKHGEVVLVDIKRPRNLRHHRLYFALVTLVWENLPEETAMLYKSPDELHDAIKVMTGLVREVRLPDGRSYIAPGSIAFDKMDQAAFEAFFDGVCEIVSKYFLPGVTSQELVGEIEEMIGATIS